MYLNFQAVFALSICAVVASDESFLNEKVMTVIDISSQLVKVRERITLVNKRSDATSSYIYTVDPSRRNNLSYIEAEDYLGNSLYVNRVTTDDSSVRFEILFHNTLFPSKTDTIDVHTVFTNCLQSYPKSIKQHEKHLVVFTFNVYYYSLYFTELQTLVLNAGQIDVNTLTEEAFRLANRSNEGLKYGPFYNMNSEAVYHTKIHFETNSPYLAVENLDRFIKISHWGYINVWDKVSLRHTGPNLIGPFERIVGNEKLDTRIESFVTSLPKDAFDIYLNDEIGLIHSFSLSYNNPSLVEVHIKPRFVLYGGWKTQIEIGYSLHIKNYVSYHKNSHNFYNLFIPLVERLYPNMFIKKAQVNIILPEGGIYQDINPYYEVENNTKKKYCYFVDLICREIVSFKVQNLVDQHSTNNFQLTYYYSQLHLFTKPIVLSAFVYSIFLLVLVYIHLTTNYSVNKERKQSYTFCIAQGKPATVNTINNKQEEPIQSLSKQKKKLSNSRRKSRKR